MGTGSRQRHISQSQASLGGNVPGETTGVESSGGNFPGGNLPVTDFLMTEKKFFESSETSATSQLIKSSNINVNIFFSIKNLVRPINLYRKLLSIKKTENCFSHAFQSFAHLLQQNKNFEFEMETG